MPIQAVFGYTIIVLGALIVLYFAAKYIAVPIIFILYMVLRLVLDGMLPTGPKLPSVFGLKPTPLRGARPQAYQASLFTPKVATFGKSSIVRVAVFPYRMRGKAVKYSRKLMEFPSEERVLDDFDIENRSIVSVDFTISGAEIVEKPEHLKSVQLRDDLARECLYSRS